MLLLQRIKNRFFVQCGACSVMHGNVKTVAKHTGYFTNNLKTLLQFYNPQSIHNRQINYLITKHNLWNESAFFKGNSTLCCQCSRNNLKNDGVLSLQRHLSELVNTQPLPTAKKTKTPKVNLTLVQELQKLDKEFEQNKKKLQAAFPLPKSNLHNSYSIISSQLNTELKVRFAFQHVSQAPACWQCTVTVPWPADKQFTSRGASKSESANRASLLALEWLQALGKIDSKGEVNLKVKINRQVPKQTPMAEIELSEENIASIEQIVSKYYTNIVQVEEKMVEEKETSNTEVASSDGEEEIEFEIDLLPTKREKMLFPRVADRRDQELFRRFKSLIERRDELSGALPIHKFREEILSLVENNRVVVVKGEPGCGKSTQVPQYILESYASLMTATDCNIVVTQPRRISAISLAERVAQERDEQVGDVVGYQVRLNAKRPKYSDGYILFCSTGLLLRKIVDDPGLSGVTHVIVDEAHERDTQVDFLLLLLKRALECNPSLKVIVMSATINAELFTNFFNDCPSITIPGFTYPVKHHYLDNTMKTMLQRRRVKFDEEDAKRPIVNIKAILEMISWIDQTKPDGAILVFLPGWLEIRTIMEELSALNNSDHYLVVPAHSKLNSNEQKRIFEVPKDGKRKVILATNIAETSLTINDVVYVIDSGAVKEERLDLRTGLVCLDNQWVSQANVSQRRGRAGRVQPGESYHMFSEQKFNSLEQFPIPEISRIPLTRSVLDVKMYTKDEDIRQFMLCLPEAPRAESVAQAIRALQGLGALDSQESLTALGRRIYKLPLDPHLSKALVTACIFKCVSPILTIATLLSADYPLFEDTLGTKSRIREVKQKLNPSSDHLALSRLYLEWELQDLTDPVEARTDCQLNGVIYRSMERTRQLCDLHAGLLKGAELIAKDEDISDISASCNTFSRSDDLITSVLLSGLGKILIYKQPTKKKELSICTMGGSPAIISSESVMSKSNELPSPFLLYFKSISSTHRRAVMVHECSLLSPLSVLLFLPGAATLRKMADMDPDKAVISIEGPKPIIILVNEKDGERLLHLRKLTLDVLEYFMVNEGDPKDVEQYKTTSDFRNELLSLLAKLLSDYRVAVDRSASNT